MDEFGARIKYLRTRQDLSQEQLARNLGVSLNTVQRWETGKTKPSPLAREKLRVLLNDIIDRDQLKLL